MIIMNNRSLEIYEMKVATGETWRLTSHSPLTWDEHAHYSPGGQPISTGARTEVKSPDWK